MGQSEWQQIFQQIFKKNLELLKNTEIETEEMNEQFEDWEKYHVSEIGEVNFPTGKVEIADPLCYINTKYGTVLKRTIIPGTYKVLVSRYIHPVFGMRHLTAKLEITEEKAVCYKLAMGDEEGLSGLGVDTGLGCICDKQTAIEFDAFLNKWHEENAGKNHYDDYFAALFKESAIREPKYQYEDGSYLTWTVPKTENKVVMLNSGFGDGYYNAYWGLDRNDKICCLVIRFIDPKSFDVPMPEIKLPKKFKLKAEEIKPLIEPMGWCIATDRITVEGCKVGYMYREKSEREDDSGWRFFEGTEDDDYVNDVEKSGIYDVNTIANYDPDIIPLLDAPTGMAFFRADDGKFYVDRQ